MHHLDIRVLGAIEVRVDGVTIDLGTRKQRQLLALLLAHRGRQVSTHQIVQALWGYDAPDRRRKDVWVYLSRLRSSLGEASDIVERSGGGYMAVVDDENIDAARFRAMYAEAQALGDSDPEAVSLLLTEALSMWKGAPFGEFSVEEFAAEAATHLSETRLRALERKIATDLSWRDPSDVLPEAESLVAAHPERPAFTGALMKALYGAGRQAEALASYRSFAQRMAESTGLEPPSELKELEERILLDDGVARPGPPLHSNLPHPFGHILGRDTEIEKIAQRLRSARLLTLVGPGGVGKTTLALASASASATVYAATVFVDANLATNQRDLLSLIATGIGCPIDGELTESTIAAHMRNRPVLVLLDNCEALAEGCAVVARSILQAAPRARVLATSRSPLGLREEPVFVVAPLDSTVSHELLAALLSEPAASDRSAGFDTLVESTGGLPLAIELLAARLRRADGEPASQDLAQSFHEQNLSDSRSDRHASMAACIEWSEAALPAGSRAVFRRLSVFSHDFTAEAATKICGFGSISPDVVPASLDELADCSLVAFDRTSRRYQLLAPIQDFADQRLRELGEEDEASMRHTNYYIEQGLRHHDAEQSGDSSAVDRFMLDAPNVLAAVRRSIRIGDAAAARRGCIALADYWRQRMDIREITQLVRDALDMDRDPTRERAQLLFETYGTLWVAGHGEEALQRATELSAIGAASEDAEVKGWAVLRGADAKSLGTHNVDEVVAAYERAIMLLRQAHSPHLTWALHQAAWYTLWTWRHWDQAESMAAEWLSTSLAVGNDRDVGLAEQFIAWLAAAQRQTARAEAHAEIAAQTLRTIGNHREAALTSGVRAIAAAQRGNYSDALSQFAIHVTTIEVMGARSWLGGALLNRAAVAAAHDVATAREDVLRAGNLITATRQFEAAREFAYVAAMTVARAEPTLAATLVGAALDPKRDGGVRSDTLSMVVPATQQHGWDPTTDLDDRLGPRANARARSVWGYLDDRELIARTVHALRAPAPTI